MKYLYGIAAFIAVISLAFLTYTFFQSSPRKADKAITVNDRTISVKEFRRKYKEMPDGVKDPYAARRKKDFIQSLITKELLIQEAKREGIDREESFRRSVQNFYEQSLIKILLDRKYASLHFAASDAEVNRYLRLEDKKVFLTVAIFPDQAAVRKNTPIRTEKKAALFRDLANELKVTLIELGEGAASRPVPVGDHYETYRLTKVEAAPGIVGHGDRKEARRLIEQYQREKAMNDWLSGLHRKATIQVFIDEKNEVRP